MTYRSQGHFMSLNDWDNSFFLLPRLLHCFYGVPESVSVEQDRLFCQLRHGLDKHWTIIVDGRVISALIFYATADFSRFARYFTFLFLVYDVIARQNSALGYFLLTEKSIFEKMQRQINSISVAQLEYAASEIKATRKCTDGNIFALEHQVQVVAKSAPNSYVKCYE